jgi:hypothetical protein
MPDATVITARTMVASRAGGSAPIDSARRSQSDQVPHEHAEQATTRYGALRARSEPARRAGGDPPETSIEGETRDVTTRRSPS